MTELSLWGWWRLRWRLRKAAHCPSCSRRGVCEWHETDGDVARGGRWCVLCGYGVQPPEVTA